MKAADSRLLLAYSALFIVGLHVYNTRPSSVQIQLNRLLSFSPFSLIIMNSRDTRPPEIETLQGCPLLASIIPVFVVSGVCLSFVENCSSV